jgi:hypothetical protein
MLWMRKDGGRRGGREKQAPGEPQQYEWPDCAPLPAGALGESTSFGDGVQYERKEVSPGRWQWTPNTEVYLETQAREATRKALYWALRSRVLSDEEMAQVDRYGDQLNIDLGKSYMPTDKARELNDALAQQMRLRMMQAPVP